MGQMPIPLHAPRERHTFLCYVRRPSLPVTEVGEAPSSLVTPTSSNGHKFIIIAMDYFTKWVEAMYITHITGRAIAHFLIHYILFRFGVTQTLVTGNGTQLR